MNFSLFFRIDPNFESMHHDLSYLTVFVYVFTYILMILFFVHVALHTGAVYYALTHLYAKRTLTVPEGMSQWPGVTIIKPLTTVDAAIYSNLETYFQMDYPSIEIFLCFQEVDDATLMLVQTLKKKYPNVSCQIVISDCVVGVNPKINNMNTAYLRSKYNLLLISDCGIQMQPTALKDMVMTLYEDDRVGLVHQVPWMVQRPGFANTMQTVYFGTWHAKMYVGAAFFGFTCTSGMSCLMRKDVIDEAGGLASFGPYLAEDYFLAKHFHRNGWRIIISHQPAWQNPGSYSVKAFQERVMRWYKLRTAMLPHTFILEPLTECLTATLLFAFAFSYNFKCVSFWVFFFCYGLTWLLLDYVLLRIMCRTTELMCSKFDFFWAWLSLVLSSTYLQLKAIFKPSIVWRSRSYRVRWGGVAEEITTGDVLTHVSVSKA